MSTRPYDQFASADLRQRLQLGLERTILTQRVGADFADVVVRVSWMRGAPAWQMNDEPIDGLSAIRERLAAIFAVNHAAPIVIDPDDAVPMSHVVELYDLVRAAGFAKVHFAASGLP